MTDGTVYRFESSNDQSGSSRNVAQRFILRQDFSTVGEIAQGVSGDDCHSHSKREGSYQSAYYVSTISFQSRSGITTSQSSSFPSSFPALLLTRWTGSEAIAESSSLLSERGRIRRHLSRRIIPSPISTILQALPRSDRPRRRCISRRSERERSALERLSTYPPSTIVRLF